MDIVWIFVLENQQPGVSMPSRRAKKNKPVREVGAAELEDMTNAPVDKALVDQAHNLQQYCCSVVVLATVVRSWPWHHTSKAAVRQFLSSDKNTFSVGFSQVRELLKHVQCDTCTNKLVTALRSALLCEQLPITKQVSLTTSVDTSSLILKGITADTLAQLVRVVKTAAGGDKGGGHKTPAQLIAAAQQTAAADKLVCDVADISADEVAGVRRAAWRTAAT
jgi:ribosomal protein S26